MSWSAEGLNPNIAKWREQNCQAPIKLASRLREASVRYQTQQNFPRDNPPSHLGGRFSFKMEIVASRYRRIDSATVLTLHQLWKKDQKDANQMLEGLNDRPKAEMSFGRRNLLHRCAVRAAIKE